MKIDNIKMSYSKLSLSRKDFETNAPLTFQKLLNNKDLTDVTLVTGDDQQIRAHKIILSSSSPFFRNIFIRNPRQNPLLYLKDITSKFLEGGCTKRDRFIKTLKTTPKP